MTESTNRAEGTTAAQMTQCIMFDLQHQVAYLNCTLLYLDEVFFSFLNYSRQRFAADFGQC